MVSDRSYAPNDWFPVIERATDELGITDRLGKAIRDRETVLPSPWGLDIYRALYLTPPTSVRVVIIGQDPYPNVEHATGLAFGTKSEKLPGSLRNICAEVYRSTGQTVTDFTLESWARQGVLLLNTHLTNNGKPLGHDQWGWDQLTAMILRMCVLMPQDVIYCLWGRRARGTMKRVAKNWAVEIPEGNYILESSYPSPLSHDKTNEPFTGCDHFSTINDILDEPIRWGEEL